MTGGRIIVCEKTGRWGAAFRRALPAVCLCETRSWAACLRELQARRAALVALEVSAENVEASCQRVVQLSLSFVRVRSIVLTGLELEPLQWLFREAGAVGVAFSWEDVIELKPLIQRFLDRLPSSSMPFRQQVWSRLPWVRYATSGAGKQFDTRTTRDDATPDDEIAVKEIAVKRDSGEGQYFRE